VVTKSHEGIRGYFDGLPWGIIQTLSWGGNKTKTLDFVRNPGVSHLILGAVRVCHRHELSPVLGGRCWYAIITPRARTGINVAK